MPDHWVTHQDCEHDARKVIRELLQHNTCLKLIRLLMSEAWPQSDKSCYKMLETAGFKPLEPTRR